MYCNGDGRVKGKLWLQPCKTNLFFAWRFTWQSAETKMQNVEQKKQQYLHSKHTGKDAEKVLLNTSTRGLRARARGL